MKLRGKLFGIETEYLFSLFVLYAIAHGGLLLILDAIYWDDWTLYNVEAPAILEIYRMAGSVFNQSGYLHVALLAAGPWLYRVLTFVLMFASGVLLWKILERHPRLTIEARYSIVLLFLLLPLYGARVALINFPSILCYFLFSLAWYCVGRQRILALALFFLSFNLNSLLVFYVMPIAEWYLRGGARLEPRAVWQWAVRRLDFLALPFVYWFVKRTYFRPYGLMQGYNEHFSADGLMFGPVLMAADLSRVEVGVVLLFAFLLAAAFFVRKPDLTQKQGHIGFLLGGIVALVCAVFPYWVVGSVPTFAGWLSRHQLLMPLGMALILVWLLQRVPVSVRHATFVLLVAVSLGVNVQAYAAFHREWSKEKELVALMSQNDAIRKASVVVFDDRTVDAGKRQYAVHEWNGLMKLAYGDETRFGLLTRELDAYVEGRYDGYFSVRYSSRDHVRQASAKSVFVEVVLAPKAAQVEGRLMDSFGRQRYGLVVTEGGLAKP